MKKILGILLVGVLLLSPLMMVAKPAFAATATITPTAMVARGGDWATITATVQQGVTPTGTYMRVKFYFLLMPSLWSSAFEAKDFSYAWVDYMPLTDYAGGSFGWYPKSNVASSNFDWVSLVRGKVNWSAHPGSYVYKMEVYDMGTQTSTTPSGVALDTATGLLTITAGLPSMDWWALALLVIGLIGIGILTLRRNRTRTI